MLAHQLDDERFTRYRKPSFFSFTPDGVLRIRLVDWTPHPNPDCAARGYGATGLVDFGGDLLGLNTNACIDNHSLYPLGDGQGAAIGYRCNGVCAFAVAGPGSDLQSLMLTAFGEALPRPPLLSPVDRADFSSGSTARWARRMGRDLLALVGSLRRGCSVGSLIRLPTQAIAR